MNIHHSAINALMPVNLARCKWEKFFPAFIQKRTLRKSMKKVTHLDSCYSQYRQHRICRDEDRCKLRELQAAEKKLEFGFLEGFVSIYQL